jgi:hypothetical protein
MIDSKILRFLICYLLASLLQSVLMPFSNLKMSSDVPMRGFIIAIDFVLQPFDLIYELVTSFNLMKLASAAFFLIVFVVMWLLLTPKKQA